MVMERNQTFGGKHAAVYTEMELCGTHETWASLGAHRVKNLPAMPETWVWSRDGSPGEGNGHPLQYSCLENPHGQRSLAGYSPWGQKGSDTTERLSTHTQFPYLLKWILSQKTGSISSPWLFWHQGPVSWKTIFPQTRGGGWFQDDLSSLHLLRTLFLLLLHQLHLRSSGIWSYRLGSPGL